MSDKKLVEGQKLWAIFRRPFGGPQYVTVGKVGRKWAEVSGPPGSRNLRVNVDNLWIEGGRKAHFVKCYLSKEEWDLEMARGYLWDQVLDAVRSYSPPACTTIEDLRTILRLLGREPDPQVEKKTPEDAGG